MHIFAIVNQVSTFISICPHQMCVKSEIWQCDAIETIGTIAKTELSELNINEK